jgi:enamine deaminase RidA (YjgF/YER057c/UK114 family)
MGTRGYASWKFVATTQEIVYFNAANDSAGGLRVHNLGTGTERRVAGAAGLRMLLVAPDGNRAVYTTDTELRIVALRSPADSTSVIPATSCAFPLTWAPDSRRLLCSDLESESLYVLDVVDRSRRALLPRPDPMLTYSSAYNYANATWSADGRFIFLSGQYGVVQEVARQWIGVTAEAVARMIRR